MGNKRLNAVITIGGAVSSSLGSAFGAIRGETTKVGQSIQQLTNRQRELNAMLVKAGRDGARGSELRIQYAQQELGMIGKQIAALKHRQQLEDNVTSSKQKFQSGMIGMTAGAFAVGALARIPLKAYEDLDAAMNNMEVAFMSKGGGLPSQLEEIKKQTVELGNALPGTTADFVNLATALKEQGAPVDAIVGGALKSAAHLSVVMKMVPEQAGEMVAKLREAFHLSDSEFGKMADYTQRARFGFGMKADDMLLGAKYYGGKLNALGLTGAANVRNVYAIQGMAAQQGMDGSTFGTNFSMFLTRMGMMKERLNKNSKEMKAVNAELHKAGINMEFFKNGKFAGMDNLVAQMDKLKVLSQEKRLQVLTRFFGEEGGRVADLIARNGVDGYTKALATIDNEASLDQRIDKSVSSFKNKLEALGGTVTNLMAAIGEPIAKMLEPAIGKLNDMIGKTQEWVSANEGLVGNIASVAGLLLGSLAAWKLAALGINGVAFAFNALKLAFATNPIGLLVVLLTTAAVMIYKNWEPIKAFFADLWTGIVDGAKKAFDWIIGKATAIGSFFGIGGASPGTASVPGSAALPSVPASAPGATKPALPSVPQMAARGGANVTNNNQTTINVTQQPGQDTKALADEIERRQKQRAGVRSRSSLVDGVGAQ